MTFGLIATVFVIVEGHLHGEDMGKHQPSKLAAMESHWETQTRAPLYLIVWPDEKNERNLIQALPIPGMLSLLAHADMDAEVIGLKDIPKDERPPVLINFLAFRGMVGLGVWLLAMVALGWKYRNKLIEKPLYLKLMVLSIPIPYLAIQMGWILAEVGRQPWIVYGLMKTSDAYSPISASQNGLSLIAFFVVYAFLAVVGYYLIFKNLKKRPGAAASPDV